MVIFNTCDHRQSQSRYDGLETRQTSKPQNRRSLFDVELYLSVHKSFVSTSLKAQFSLLKGQCQLQCIARSNNAWRPFYWQSNSCFGFQSVIYFNHPMVILAHFNRIVTTKHQRNVYNRYLLTFHHFQGKM